MKDMMIPKAWVLEFDDVGWDNGEDLRLSHKAPRSGLPRYHTREDYQLLVDIGTASDMTINVALCLGDWDKDNLLRGEVGLSHDPYGWDRKREIDDDRFSEYRALLDCSPYVDYSVHGLLHGLYGADGKFIHGKEYFDFVEEGGRKKIVLRSEEDLNRRLGIFFKIYKSWGFEKDIKVFISPSGLGYASQEELNRTAGELYKHGIRYWTNGGFCFSESVKVIQGVACVKKCLPLKDGKPYDVPWNATDVDPSEFSDVTQTDIDSCVLGLHWTNLLRFNPKKNVEQVTPWVKYIQRQGEVFGLVNARNLAEAANQQVYYEYADVQEADGTYCIDLSGIEAQRVDCHENTFFVSFKNGVEPTGCEGGEIALYRTQRDFKTYKVCHTDRQVVIHT